MTTLRPILAALGYEKPEQQRAWIRLLTKTGSFQQEPLAYRSDRNADALLDHLHFSGPDQAMDWLHHVTQSHWLRPSGLERCQVTDSPELAANRDALVPQLAALGQISEISPAAKHYDHVLVLGAMEGAVEKRLNTLVKLAEEGVTFGEVSLLGCQRPLAPGHESRAGTLSAAPGGNTESGMMIAEFRKLQPNLPESLRTTPVTLVDTPNRVDGARADTKDTARSWLSTKPRPGSVLVISDQPHVAYQHAAVRSALPEAFTVETVGQGADAERVPVAVALDDMARQIDVSLPRLRAELRHQAINQKLEQVHMIPVESIDVNPEMLQFRSGGNARGETKAHRVDGPRDPLLCGMPLVLYARRNGAMEIIDGHHRFAQIQRERAAGRGPEEVAVRILFEHDGITPPEALAIGAYINFAQEFSKPEAAKPEPEMRDAARVFHLVHTGQVREEVLPRIRVQGALADAYMAGSLSPQAFSFVERGVPVAMAADLAGRATTPDTQVAVMSLLSSRLQQQAVMR